MFLVVILHSVTSRPCMKARERESTSVEKQSDIWEDLFVSVSVGMGGGGGGGGGGEAANERDCVLVTDLQLPVPRGDPWGKWINSPIISSGEPRGLRYVCIYMCVCVRVLSRRTK